MFIADFHIHSKYSRATSRDCVTEMLELWARRKGLRLIGTGDFTHPAWRAELADKLIPAEEGLYMLREGLRVQDGSADGCPAPRFIVSGEISSIYKQDGRVRKVHNLILLPSLEAAAALSRRLESIGGNLRSDGRPILGLSSRDLLEITLEAAPDAVFIPAHIWTPHFSLFGAYSGFDDIHQCFGDLTDHIHALETGLSSDPAMNARLSALDGFTLVSNSDAHSPANLGREANLFDTALSYPHIARALDGRDPGAFRGTLEFFPEEGKYHYDGHRNCKVCMKPSDTVAAAGVCPVCGGRITVGVLHRVEALADRAEDVEPPRVRHFESLIALREVIAASLGLTPASKKVGAQYDAMLRALGPELYILREAPLEDIARRAGALTAEGIRRLRGGQVDIQPGYDGEYGKIRLFGAQELLSLSGQLSFLGAPEPPAPQSTETSCGETAPQPKPADASRAADGPSDAPSGHSYGLNAGQWAAVSAPERAVAVVAGPGTGKTMTLVSRVAWLIEKGVPPAHITAVTFTNKAAKELRDRLSRQFPGSRALRKLTVGTFHAIGLNQLSRSHRSATLIDETAALSIAEDIVRRLGLKLSPREMLRHISRIKNGAPCDIAPEAVSAYDEALRQYGALDFDDILLRALECAESPDTAPEPCFKHILVDEFQDINPVQYRLVSAWSRCSDSVFVIGDPNQSIYGFRGSDPRCFAGFLADFAPVREIRLTQNYRSTPEILRCAQAVLAGRHGDALQAVRPGGTKVRLLTTEDAFSEALFVSKEIARLVGGIDMLGAHAGGKAAAAKWGFGDIAVLYRTHRQSAALEQCLAAEGIPYVVAGRDDSLADPQVRRTLAFFRFLLDPGDMLSLRACLGPDLQSSPADILESYAAARPSVAALADILEAAGPSAAFDASPALLRRYAPLVRREKPRKLLESWVEDNALSGAAGMDKLLGAAVMYADMPDFLQNLVLGQEGDILRSGQRRYTPDAVSLMTLHAAKGLEYSAVFLCGVTDGLIPYRRAHDAASMDEERRLFYVGVTRAKDALVLLTARNRSPFLDGLPADALDVDRTPTRPRPACRQLSLFGS